MSITDLALFRTESARQHAPNHGAGAKRGEEQRGEQGDRAPELVPLMALKPGASLSRRLMVHRAEVKKTRTGKDYLDLELGDRTGRIGAKRWSVDRETLEAFEPGRVLEVEARVDAWNGKLQLKVDRFAVFAEPVDPSAFLPASPRPIDGMYRALRALHATIANPWLTRLLDAFLEDDPAFRTRFCHAPAATHHHHAYVGGLLEHVLSLSEAACRTAEAYPVLDRDVLLTGVFLHDIGKVAAYEVQAGFEYTDHGRLTGHITTGVLWLEERARRIPGFPEPLLEHLRHLILSHHGRLEWGSPVEPATPEAIALHALDNLDARLWAAAAAIERAQASGERWSEFNRMLGGRVFAGERSGTAPAPLQW